MPPSVWTAIAILISAAVGAAVARAVGGAARAASTTRPPVRPLAIREARPAPQAPSGPLPEPRPVVSAEGNASEVSIRVLAETGQPVRLTVQRQHADGTTSDLYRTTLPAATSPEGQPGAASPKSVRGPRLSLRRALGSWGTALEDLWVWRRLRTAQPQVILAGAAALLYLVTRLWAIDSFPIYFYSDEVTVVTLGERALEKGLVGEDGAWPAVYFPVEENRWAPYLGAYVQGILAGTFGRSIFLARAAYAVLTLVGTLSVALMLKQFVQLRFWWAVILLAVGIPAWFLYSRTAFEFGTWQYAVFLLAYGYYRFRSPRYLPLAVAAGAVAFYSYAIMQVVMVALGVCLLASDFRYHVLHRRTWFRTVPLLVLLCVPLLQYRILHPESLRATLTALGSYWMEDLPLGAKLLRYLLTYLQGLNPLYWFAPESGTGILPVQFIPGAGHLGFVMLPFVAVGLLVSIRNLRSPFHRLVLLSALVIPAGSAVDTIEITRVLAMVIPALLLAGLGLEQIGAWLKAVPQGVQTAAVAILLSALGIARTADALVNGPTWPTDYGLSGAQFGAKVLFEDVIPPLLASDPEATLVMTTTWANNTHFYPDFFLTPADQERVKFGNIRDYLASPLPLQPDLIIVMTPDEFADAAASPVLGQLDVVKTVPAPNGQPAFYFARIGYAPDAERVFQELEDLRTRLVEEHIDLLGQPIRVMHSKFGDGQIANLFDGSAASFVRGDRVNPLEVELHFAKPILLQGISVTVGSIQDFTISVRVLPPGGAEPVEVSQRFVNAGNDPTVDLDLPAADVRASSLFFEITDHTQGSGAMIHVREIVLR